MRHSAAAAILFAALAGCNKQPSVTAENASVGEVAAKVAKARGEEELISPGRWEGTVTIKAMDVPGLPPEQQKMMAAHAGQARPIVACVTPEDAKARKAFLTGDEMKSCRYDSFSMAGGKIDAKLSCDQAGAKVAATIKGTYAPDRYTIDMTSAVAGMAGTGGAPMTTTVSVDSKRVGECRGDERKRG